MQDECLSQKARKAINLLDRISVVNLIHISLKDCFINEATFENLYIKCIISDLYNAIHMNTYEKVLDIINNETLDKMHEFIRRKKQNHE